MRLASSWAYAGDDICARFFGTSLRALDPEFPEAARVLEVGCAEFDWQSYAHRDWPSLRLTGIDSRKGESRKGMARITADVMTVSLPAESFDWILGISAFEHIGLGHYGDPVNPDGDRIALDRAWRWLVPGGWLYFDVPYDTGGGFRVRTVKYRVYDDDAIQERLAQGHPWRQAWHGVATLDAPDVLLTERPPVLGGFDQYFGGFWWQKPS